MHISMKILLFKKTGSRCIHASFPAPEQWTMVPVMVKIYKLLINELSNQIESSMSTKAALGDDEDEEVKFVHNYYPFSAGTVFIRRPDSDVCRRQNLTYKDVLRTKRKYL